MEWTRHSRMRNVPLRLFSASRAGECWGYEAWGTVRRSATALRWRKIGFPPRNRNISLWSRVDRFNDCAHRSLGVEDPPVWSVRAYLITLQLGPLAMGGIDNDTTGPIHRYGHLVGDLHRMPKEMGEHLDDILVGVVVVVEQHDVIPGNGEGFVCLQDMGQDFGARGGG